MRADKLFKHGICFAKAMVQILKIKFHAKDVFKAIARTINACGFFSTCFFPGLNYKPKAGKEFQYVFHWDKWWRFNPICSCWWQQQFHKSTMGSRLWCLYKKSVYTFACCAGRIFKREC